MVQADPARLGHFDDFFREIGRTGRRVLESGQLGRKSVKIVDRARARHRRDRRRADEPVGGDDEQGARPRQLISQFAPAVRESVALERIHRASMADEEGWHSAHGGSGIA
jgi:hypothetical protein